MTIHEYQVSAYFGGAKREVYIVQAATPHAAAKNVSGRIGWVDMMFTDKYFETFKYTAYTPKRRHARWIYVK